MSYFTKALHLMRLDMPYRDRAVMILAKILEHGGCSYSGSVLRSAVIESYLYQLIGKEAFFTSHYHSDEGRESIGHNAPIYMMWWQGWNSAPEVVQLCRRSLEKYMGGSSHPLVFLDESNIGQYVEINPQYFDLLKQGEISTALLSDAIRLHLISQRGGVWLDATYFLTKPMPEEIFDLPLWTIRDGKPWNFPISKGLWCGNAFGAAKGNPEISLCMNVFNTYFETHTRAIDYLLIDCIIAMCVDLCPNFINAFTQIPINNSGLHGLQHVLDLPSLAMSNLDGETYLFKLTWKRQYKEYVETNGILQPTVYHDIKQMPHE